MSVLVLYSSTEGQAKKVAEQVAKHAEAAGHAVAIYNMGSDAKVPRIASFDVVIAAASVHQGHHQDSALTFIAAQAGELNLKKSAFISVSLSAAMADGKAEAQAYVDRFLDATGWKPHMCLLAAGAIRLSSYDYFERQVMKYIVMQKGVARDMDVDYECTDWPELEAFVETVLDAGTKVGVQAAGRSIDKANA